MQSRYLKGSERGGAQALLIKMVRATRRGWTCSMRMCNKKGGGGPASEGRGEVALAGWVGLFGCVCERVGLGEERVAG